MMLSKFASAILSPFLLNLDSEFEELQYIGNTDNAFHMLKAMILYNNKTLLSFNIFLEKPEFGWVWDGGSRVVIRKNRMVAQIFGSHRNRCKVFVWSDGLQLAQLYSWRISFSALQ